MPKVSRKRGRPAKAVELVIPSKICTFLGKEQEQYCGIAPHRVKLPLETGAYTAERVLGRFEANLSERHSYKDKEMNSSVLEVIQGIPEVFGKALLLMLCYKQEVNMYESEWSQIPPGELISLCGVEFLIRLLVKLPSILITDIKDADSAVIITTTNELLKFIDENFDEFTISRGSTQREETEVQPTIECQSSEAELEEVPVPSLSVIPECCNDDPSHFIVEMECESKPSSAYEVPQPMQQPSDCNVVPANPTEEKALEETPDI